MVEGRKKKTCCSVLNEFHGMITSFSRTGYVYFSFNNLFCYCTPIIYPASVSFVRGEIPMRLQVSSNSLRPSSQSKHLYKLGEEGGGSMSHFEVIHQIQLDSGLVPDTHMKFYASLITPGSKATLYLNIHLPESSSF